MTLYYIHITLNSPSKIIRINEFSKFQDTRFIQTSVAFLRLKMNYQKEKAKKYKTKNPIWFKIASKRIKYLGINFNQGGGRPILRELLNNDEGI